MNSILPFTISIALLSVSGCATVQPRQAFPDVAKQVEDRTGVRTIWNEGTAADTEVQQSIRELLDRDLTAESSVQIALLNNPNVQATYEELGIAQGELVQAGLLSNPVFTALLRFPDGARGSPNLEMSVSQNFLDLLTLPLKKQVAAAQYEAAQARVGGEVVALAADVRRAFVTLQAAQQMVELRQSIAAAAAASSQAAERIHDAGNNSDLAVANEQAVYVQAKIDLSIATAEIAKDRESLAVLLGLSESGKFRITERLPELPATDDGLSDVEVLALHQRLDFTTAINETNALTQSYGLSRQFVWLNGSQLTIDGEHEPDGSWVTGPGVAFPVPIFDTGAAQVSVARGRVRQAVQKLAAMRLRICSEARAARAEMFAARERAEYYRTTAIPLRQKITHQTQLQFNGMLMSVYSLLQAKRDEIDAGRGYIEALRDYWLARTELERTVGGRLPIAAESPTTAPAANNHDQTK